MRYLRMIIGACLLMAAAGCAYYAPGYRYPPGHYYYPYSRPPYHWWGYR
jgi:hypothetical protein